MAAEPVHAARRTPCSFVEKGATNHSMEEIDPPQRGSALWLILGACLLAAILGQAWLIPVDADVSWLITVSERVLAGQQL